MKRARLSAPLAAPLAALVMGIVACGAASPPEDRAATLTKHEKIVGDVLSKLYEPADSPYEDEDMARYVREVATRTARGAGLSGRSWDVLLLDQPDVNAYSILGGHIYVTRGMLAMLSSEAELAAVIAHEMAHVTAGHGLHTVSDLRSGRHAEDAETAARNRDKEHQADRIAIGYLGEAGYEPRAFVSMLRSLLAWRPGDRDRTWDPARIARAALFAESAGHGETLRDDYLARLDGLVLDDDPRFGRVDGTVYVHEMGGFALTLPEAMNKTTDDHQLFAADMQDGTAFFVRPTSELMAETMRKAMKEQGHAEPFPAVGYNLIAAPAGDMWRGVLSIPTKARVRSFFFAALGPDAARAKALFFRVAGTLRATTPGEHRAPRRLHTAKAERAGLLGDLLSGVCGGPERADQAMSLELHGPGAATSEVEAGSLLKCASPALR